jgi:hypothetical protein
MKINELIKTFEIYTTIEEQQLLTKLHRPTKLSSLPERERQLAENMIRKSLLIKIGHNDPDVVINEY